MKRSRLWLSAMPSEPRKQSRQWVRGICFIPRTESLNKNLNDQFSNMRDKLIRRIVELSKEVDDDNLEYMNWNLESNDSLLEMFKRLISVQTIMKAREYEAQKH